MMTFAEPCAANSYHAGHVQLMRDSLRHFSRRDLPGVESVPANEVARWVFDAPFALLAHDTQPDPVFNYANRTALHLFELDWAGFMALPSRLSVEAAKREDRAKLLADVSRHGYVENYRGIRVSASGTRFLIEGTTVWNLLDDEGLYRGQAALITRWGPLLADESGTLA